ncbi:hypothetical protein ACOMHN_053319 [Nucella lapillus]
MDVEKRRYKKCDVQVVRCQGSDVELPPLGPAKSVSCPRYSQRSLLWPLMEWEVYFVEWFGFLVSFGVH